jgi:hypothetical protein
MPGLSGLSNHNWDRRRGLLALIDMWVTRRLCLQVGSSVLTGGKKKGCGA